MQNGWFAPSLGIRLNLGAFGVEHGCNFEIRVWVHHLIRTLFIVLIDLDPVGLRATVDIRHFSFLRAASLPADPGVQIRIFHNRFLCKPILFDAYQYGMVRLPQKYYRDHKTIKKILLELILLSQRIPRLTTVPYI